LTRCHDPELAEALEGVAQSLEDVAARLKGGEGEGPVPVIVPRPKIVRPDYESVGWGVSRESHYMAPEQVEYLVIHHDGSPTDQDKDALGIHRYHRSRGWAGIGYHFWIRKDGLIQEGRPLWAMGAHADRRGPPPLQYNRRSIAVALAGNYCASVNTIGPPTAQWNAAVHLLAWLLTQFPNVKEITGHRYLPGWAGFTSCPGDWNVRVMATEAQKLAREGK